MRAILCYAIAALSLATVLAYSWYTPVVAPWEYGMLLLAVAALTLARR